MSRQVTWHRVVLGLFAALDVILILRFYRSVRLPHLIRDIAWWANALEVLRPVFLLSMVASAVGLSLAKSWGYIVSYVQVPFRYAFVLLSFGFITLLTGSPSTYRAAVYVAMVLEAARLAVTILIHVKSVRTPAG